MMIPRFGSRAFATRVRASLSVLAVLVVLGLILVIPAGSLAQQEPSPEALTHGLAGLILRYQTAAPEDQARLLSELTSAAATRRDHLAALMETDPGAVLRVALPAALRAGLPAEVQAYLEQEVEEEGELEVLHEDYETSGRYLYFLQTAAERLSLHFAADPPGLVTGTRVRARGLRLGGAMALSSGSSVTALSTIAPNTFGEQKAIVILVTFQDNPTQPYTSAYAAGVVFTASNSANLYYQENSYQQTSLAGDVIGWFTISQSSTSCDYSKTASLAEQAATAAGVNLSAYSRRIYAFPKNACSWWGLGTVGGNPSKAWVNGSFVLRVVGHELGHNYGDYHSHSLACAGTTCTASEYGDGWDIMGATSGHLTTFQKERLGWLNYNSSPPITTVTADGTYWLDPYETNTTNPKALKILKATDPATGKKTWYYVEYRAKQGFDSNLAAAVLVHTGSESSADRSYLWDLDQATSVTDWILDVGQTYSDPNAAVTITTTQILSGSATVLVSSGSVTCVRANPTIVLSPSATQWVSPGTAVPYTVTVTNKDNSGCAAANFNLQATVPAGWTSSFGASSLSLSPGASGSTSFTVTSPASAPDGFYTIGVTATNSADASYAGSTTVSVSIQSVPCAPANPALALSPSATQSVSPGTAVPYTVTVTNKDNSGCAASTFSLQASVPTGWTGTFGVPSLTLNPGASGSTSFTVTSPASATAGSYTISVTATNGSYAGSASVTEMLVTSLSVAVTTDQSSYKGGQWVTVSAIVKAGQSPASTASVIFTITNPVGGVVTGTANTDANGTAMFKFHLKGNDPIGQWSVQADATLNGLSGTNTATFMVQ